MHSPQAKTISATTQNGAPVFVAEVAEVYTTCQKYVVGGHIMFQIKVGNRFAHQMGGFAH